MSGETNADSARQAELTRRLLDSGLWLDLGVAGLFGRGAGFVDLVQRLERALDALAADPMAERVRFPPLLPREVLRRTGFMETMPHLCGSVHSYDGDERGLGALLDEVEAGGDWSPHLSQTTLTLAPAGCYPLYGTLRGTLPAGGRMFDLVGSCFRREPSDDPMRLQAFEMREQVRAGTPEQVQQWRLSWLERAPLFFEQLGLEVEVQTANDPFFGRSGKMLMSQQREQKLKFELGALVCSNDRRTALASFNYHQDHFTTAFEIDIEGAEVAHTACVGFGLDRVVVALLERHGLDFARWPEEIRRVLQDG